MGQADQVEIGSQKWTSLSDGSTSGFNLEELPLNADQIKHNETRQALLDQNMTTEAAELGSAILLSFRAIGAIANKRYLSGRYIPAATQEDALRKAREAGRQMTTYLDHPTVGVNCGPKNFYIGLSENLAGKAVEWRFENNVVIIDRLEIYDTTMGRKFYENYKAGYLYGLSQRALGREEPREIVIDSMKVPVNYVTDMYGIFGWDLVLLDTANAGVETELEPLTDNFTGGQPINQTQGSEPMGVKKHEVRLTDQNTKAVRTEFIEISDDSTLSTEQLDAKAHQLFDSMETSADAIIGLFQKAKGQVSQIVAWNAEISDDFSVSDATAKGLFDSIVTEDWARNAGVELNDDFKSRYLEYVADDDFYDHTSTAVWVGISEAWRIRRNDDLSLEEKIVALTALLAQMQECFTMIAAAFIETQVEHAKMEAGDPTDPAMEDTIPAPENTVPLNDSGTNAVPPPPPVDMGTAKTLQSMLDNIAVQQQALVDQARLNALTGKVTSSINDMNIQDTVQRDFILEQMNKQITSSTTDEELTQLIDNFAGLASSKASGDEANSLLDSQSFPATPSNDRPPQGGQRMDPIALNDHVFGSDILKGVKSISDTLEAQSGFELSFKKKNEEPRALTQMTDNFVQKNSGKLQAENALLDNMRVLDSNLQPVLDSRTGEALIDISQISNIQTPATLSLLILREAYANFFLLDVVQFHDMPRHKKDIPIRQWRREDGETVFKPTLLQRKRLRKGELKPIAKGNRKYEFVELAALSRKIQSEMSNEFARRIKEVESGSDALAMIVEDLQVELQTDLMMEYWDLQLWAAISHGGVQSTETKNGDASTSLFFFKGTTVSNTKAIVPHMTTTPILISIGGVTVPGLGDQANGGGPTNDFFYVPNYTQGTIQFVDSAGAAKAPPTGTNNVSINAYYNAQEVSFDLHRGAVDQDKHMDLLNQTVENRAANLNEGNIGAFMFDPNMMLSTGSVATLMDQAQIYRADGRRAKYPEHQSKQADVGRGFEGFWGVRCGMEHFVSKLFDRYAIIISRKDAVHFGVYAPFMISGENELRDSNAALIGGKSIYAEQEDDMKVPQVEKNTFVRLFTS